MYTSLIVEKNVLLTCNAGNIRVTFYLGQISTTKKIIRQLMFIEFI